MNPLCPQIFMESIENYLADCGMSKGESFLVPPLGYTIFCQELTSQTITKFDLLCVLLPSLRSSRISSRQRSISHKELRLHILLLGAYLLFQQNGTPEFLRYVMFLKDFYILHGTKLDCVILSNGYKCLLYCTSY